MSESPETGGGVTPSPVETAERLRRAGRMDQAVATLRQAIAREPEVADTHFRLGLLLHQAAVFEQAIESYRRVVALVPGHAQALDNMGIAQAELGMISDARATLERAVAVAPDNPVTLNNYGHLLDRSGSSRAALPHLQRAVRLSPDFDLAWSNLGDTHRSLGQWGEAVSSYERGLAIAPGSATTLSNLAYALRTLCRWDRIDELEARLLALSERALAQGQASPIDPFIACFLDMSPQAFRAIVASHAGKKGHQAAASGGTPRSGSSLRAGRGGSPIRVGYVSAQFSNHATGFLVEAMFGHHDRTRFEVYGYALRPSDGSSRRAAIEAGMDHFRNLLDLADTAAAQRISRDRIDVLVDLDGFTQGNRSGIFALRPAPLQAAYLGFPGTLGAPYMDYIIADAVVVPAEHTANYEEAVVRLPHSYQVNNHRSLALSDDVRRSELALPDDAVVLCCFNVSRKIEPRTFELWLRILSRAPQSVLWLLADGPEMIDHLRARARHFGVAPDRLIAASRCGVIDNVSRCQAADLFLDTLVCNGHTTATDALWAGLPVLTCPGQTFASRVGASVVRAAGLPELVCRSPAEYVEKAVALATERDRLAALRTKLLAGRAACPLFDTAGLVRHLEAALAEMVARFDRGDRPGPIDVASLTRHA